VTKMTALILGVLCALCGSLALAQTYKCDWCVNGLGGGDMSSAAYRCGATAGQTAAGQMTGTTYWALIGFWQTDMQVGIREEAHWPSQGPLVTKLYAPVPNPGRSPVAVRYSLACEGRTQVHIHDLTGRVVRTLVNSSQQAGRYSLRWDGRDNVGHTLAGGVYFCRLVSGEYRATEKVVLQR